MNAMNANAGKLEFGTVYIINPQASHTHTAMVLHGRGSNGQEFAQEFFSSHLSDGSSLAQRLPGWRWVFPSSPELWSTTFQEEIPAWFEAHSLTDTTARQDLQTSGLTASVKHIHGLIGEEIVKLGGNASNLMLGGISQGAAIGMWALLCAGPASGIGAFFGSNTWLPFAENLGRILGPSANVEEAAVEITATDVEYDAFVRNMLAEGRSQDETRTTKKVLLGHGADDAYVDIALGQQARQILDRAGFAVEWKEYLGAEEEGHWFKVPDQMNDLFQFIVDTMPNGGN